MGDPHTAATTTRHGFDDNGITDLTGYFDRILFVRYGAIRARHDWDSGFFHRFFGYRFVTHVTNGCGGRADEFDIAGFALLREFRIFREETKPRMDRVDISDFSRSDDTVSSQIAVSTIGTTDTNSLVCELHV